MKTNRFPMPSMIALILSVTGAGVWAAGPDPGLNVTVTNPPSSPVPVTLRGTSTVTGNVAVTNTPNVNVVNEATIRDADNPAFQPVRVRAGGSVPDDVGPHNSTVTLYTVPAGKRLVIQYVDGELNMTPAGNTAKFYFRLDVSDPDSSKSTSHPIGTSSESAPCTLLQACVVVARQTKIYANPGARISAFGSWILGAASGITHFDATMNGYLVDLQ